MGAGSPTLRAARDEVGRGLRGLLGVERARLVEAVTRDGALVAGTPSRSSAIAALDVGADLGTSRRRGLRHPLDASRPARRATVIVANTDVGVLYGVFRLLRFSRPARPIDGSLDRRGAARPPPPARPLGQPEPHGRARLRRLLALGLAQAARLPRPRYTDYARANASIGINGTVLTNVNANATSLTAE